MYMNELFFAVGKVKFLGKTFCLQSLNKQVLTINVQSTLALPSDYWGWPANPESEFANHLDGMSEGIYRVDGKQRTQNIGWSRQNLCDLILNADIRNVWCFPNEFCDSPFFELFYCSANWETWIGPQTSQKLLKDVQEWSPIINYLQSWEPIFAIVADYGFVRLFPESL